RIVRECKASSTQTTRIKRIEARADAALNGRDVSFLSVKDKRVDQVAYINQLSLQNRLKEETIAEQAAQIEMLRGVLTNMQRAGRKRGWQQSYESEMDACAEALAIPTDSKQVLSDWLDSVLGEPIDWSHHCSDNNDQEFYCVDYEPNNGMSVHRGDVPLFKKPEILK
ncbi:MAG TPA: hypothetical protein PKJ52_09675, partial [Rectinema sp.]|nr:hypothetical protein [Rectinema sp.]